MKKIENGQNGKNDLPIIAVLGVDSTLYVALVVPRLQRAASARTAQRRPTRRPPRPGASPEVAQNDPAAEERP